MTPKVARAASGLASGFLARRPVAGGKGGGRGGTLRDQARRPDNLERVTREATTDKDMRRAEELYLIQAAEFPEYAMYPAQYLEDGAPSALCALGG